VKDKKKRVERFYKRMALKDFIILHSFIKIPKIGFLVFFPVYFSKKLDKIDFMLVWRRDFSSLFFKVTTPFYPRLTSGYRSSYELLY